MKADSFTFNDDEGVKIFAYKWIPDEAVRIKAVVQIAHGMGEMASRYERLALALTNQGYAVYAHDHKGHGKTAASLDNLGYIGKAGFHGMLRDMKQLTDIIKSENINSPLFLLGHSMGSFLAQGYIQQYGDVLQGVILSGTNGNPGFTINAGILLAKGIAKLYGERHRSKALNVLVFGSYNNEFKPLRTPFDWLSRDEEEVNKYIIDPYCGTLFTASFFRDFFLFLKEIHQPNRLTRIPKQLPIYLFSGERDPVGKKGEGVKNLVKVYNELQINEVSYRLYIGGRHEMFNEINRDEATNDLLAWLDSIITWSGV
jgi:alpha-beta hydrolase superfamily lysophospholipase